MSKAQFYFLLALLFETIIVEDSNTNICCLKEFCFLIANVGVV